MPWVKLDDHFDEHPKLASVGPLGVVLWVTALAYCNRNLTDGFIPWSIARTMVSWDWEDATGPTSIFIGSPELVHEDGKVTSEYAIESLVAAGLWDRVPGGYSIHDFDEYQPTKAEVEAERAAKSAAGRAGGLAAAQARAIASAKANGQQKASKRPAEGQAKSKPVPVPVPVPDGSKEPSSRASAFDTYMECTGWPVSDKGLPFLREIVEGWGHERTATTMRRLWDEDPDKRTIFSRVKTVLLNEDDRARSEAEDRRKTSALDEARDLKARLAAASPEEQARAAALRDSIGAFVKGTA